MPEITPGIVAVERSDNGYLHVQIGRARRVKQLYLSDAEARQLLEQLGKLLSES